MTLYFVLGLLVLGVRYWVFPNIDQWRPMVVEQISLSLGVPVQLKALRAGWSGWNPYFELDHVRLRTPTGRPLLDVPRVRASLSWRSLLELRPQFLQLTIQGMDLSARRAADGTLWLLGRRIMRDRVEPGDDFRVPAWLLAQQRIVLTDATVRWRDEVRSAPELVLDEVEIRLGSIGGDRFQFSLEARTPAAMSTRLALRGEVGDVTALAAGIRPKALRAYAQLSDMHPMRWRPWLDVPEGLQSGAVSLQAWMDTVNSGEALNLTLEAQVSAMRWLVAEHARLQAPDVQVYMQAPWKAWANLGGVAAGPGADGLGTTFGRPLRVAMRSSGLSLHDSEWFTQPIELGRLDVAGRYAGGERHGFHIESLAWHNGDIDLLAQGRWQAGGTSWAGIIDLRGRIPRARLDAIHRYLPRVVDEDARAWLATGLLSGELVDGALRLQGDLAQFPFGEQPEAGDFLLRGAYRDAVIDYIPAEGETLSWPRLEAMAGEAELHRSALTLTAREARMHPSAGTEIVLTGLTAQIPDLEHQAVLTVGGDTQAHAEAYMALLQHSPLADMLDGLFEKADASGLWTVPLSLVIPLQRGRDTQVDGEVRFTDGELRFRPEMPPFKKLAGALRFTEETIGAVEPISAQFLDGALKITGQLGGDGKGLQGNGQLKARAAAAFVGQPGMRRLSGSTAYAAHLQRGSEGYHLSVTSDLTGLAMDFPAPLAKSAKQARALKVDWSHHDARNDVLNIRLGDESSARLLHRRGEARGAYFYSAGLGIRKPPPQSPAGLSIDVDYPLFDIDAWEAIAGEFSASDDKRLDETRSAQRSVLPELVSLRISTDQGRFKGLRMDQLRLRADENPPGQWRLDLRSAQTEGAMDWREKDGAFLGPVRGHFTRLSMGDGPDEGPSLLPEPEPTPDDGLDDELEIPAVELQVEDLRLYGSSVGRLEVRGVNDRPRHAWQLKSLSLHSPHMSLQGTGLWRLRGTRRGLSIKANAQVEDMGGWLRQAGFEHVMVGGTGVLDGEFEWHDLPWRQAISDLSGTLYIELDKGRFSKLGSHSARLLELLSLQSITRLTTLDQGLTGLTREGYPFDNLRGTLQLDQGVLSTHDYRVIGPVGTIVLEGRSDIAHETLDMEAVIIPNLDVSGAAIAAGIAINPIVGLGAFLTQWLLKTPLARAMTARYRISGSWDDPRIEDIPAVAPADGPPGVGVGK